MKYDIATKVLMDKAGERILERFLDLNIEYLELVEELPQETVSLKRSDYVFRVTTKEGKLFVVIWEFLSTWKRRDIMIESAAYDIIKQEGIKEGIEKGIEKGIERGIEKGFLQKAREDVIEILEARFELVPPSIVKTIQKTDDLFVLKMLHKKGVEI